MVRCLMVGLVLATLAACAGAGGAIPGGPAAPGGVAGGPQPAGDTRHRKTLARLTIKVPHPIHRRHSKYISPATASLVYTVDGGAPAVVNISTSNPACAVSGLDDLQCNVVMDLTAGTHTFSFTTYDAPNGTGHVLSANTAVSYRIVTGAPNQIPVTLGGIAAGLLLTPVSTAVSGSQPTGFSIYGSEAVLVEIVPYDEDDNYIIGPGAPQPVVPSAPASMIMQTPSPSSPNLWVLSSTSTTTDPMIPTPSSLNVEATPVPDSGGSTVALSEPLSLYQPWIYVVNGNSVSVFDEEGNPVTHAGTFATLDSPAGITYDSNRGWLYVASLSSNAVVTYDDQGRFGACTGCFSGLNEPSDVAYDSHNGWIYVPNEGSGTVTAYDYLGNTEATSAFSGLTFPSDITFDSGNDLLYVATGASGYQEYAEGGGAPTSAGAMSSLSNPNGAAYDPHDGLLYVADSGITAYDSDGNLQSLSGSWTDLSLPEHILYDPYDGHLYVTNFRGSVTAYDEQGDEIALPAPITGLTFPLGIAIVP